jgi:hypothetical protein
MPQLRNDLAAFGMHGVDHASSRPARFAMKRGTFG